jgi:hypothetical protein
MLKLMLRRDDEFKGGERAIDKPARRRARLHSHDD